MQGIQPRRRHVLGLATLACLFLFASSLGFSILPAGAQSAPPTSCPILSVGNPNPGDTLPEGGMFISGTAYDPAATTGSGVSRVDLFLGERDTGGTFIGSVVPGLGANPRAFQVQVTIPSGIDSGVDFAAYATSAISGQQTAVTFPIFVGNQPAKNPVATPTPIPTVTTVTTTCPHNQTGAPAPAPAAPAAGAPAPAAPAPAAPAVSAPSLGSCPVLSVANPNPGDSLTPGGYIISGTAYDPAATTGSGITRVDLFLGERDSGGTFLGSAVPGSGSNPRAFSVQVSVPSSFNRGVDFAAYAISAITGQQTTITFPVFVGTPPTRSSITAATPTPIPTAMTVTSTCPHM